MQNSQEKKPESKKIKVKQCPFDNSLDKSLKCEDCRFYKELHQSLGPVCVFVFLAMRSD